MLPIKKFGVKKRLQRCFPPVRGRLLQQCIRMNVVAISRAYTLPISAGRRCVTASEQVNSPR